MPSVRQIGPDAIEVIGLARTRTGQPIPSSRVDITDIINSVSASLFSDPFLQTPITTLYADTKGVYSFYCAAGHYSVTYNGVDPAIEEDIEIFTNTFGAGGAGGGGGAGADKDLFISDAAPTSPPAKYMWVQTNAGAIQTIWVAT